MKPGLEEPLPRSGYENIAQGCRVSARLPRVTGQKDRNPNGVVSGSSVQGSGQLIQPRSSIASRRNPLGVAPLSVSRSQGSRTEPRQPWAELHNRFAVERITDQVSLVVDLHRITD